MKTQTLKSVHFSHLEKNYYIRMELLKLLLLLLVILMMGKETSNQEIPGKDERTKRYHESDLIRHKQRIEQAKLEREKKNILTKSMNPRISLKTQDTPFYDPSKTNTEVTPQLMKMNQAHNTNVVNSRKPFVMITPKYDSDSKRINNENSEKTITNTANLEKANEFKIEDQGVKEKEEILDTVSIENTNEIIDKDLLLKDETNVEPREPEVVSKKTKSKKKINHHHHPHKNNKSHGDENDESKTESFDLPLLDDNLDKTQSEPTINQDKIMCNNKSTSDNNVNLENDKIIDKVGSINKDQRKQNEIQHKKHPFSDAIQNKQYITSFKDNASNLTEEDTVIETDIDETANKVKNELKILEKSSSGSNLPNEVGLTQDDSEEIIIKNVNIEEVMEVTKPITSIYQGNAQNNAPVFYKNYRQASNYNQIPRTQKYLNNIYRPNCNQAPDEQRTFQNEDGSTVVTYNNYFKLPTSYDNSNNNIYPNNNRCYEYSPSEGQSKNGNWIASKGNDKDIIRRCWNNSEYHLKSKPGMKKIDREMLHNINQINIDYKSKQRNADMNGYYRNQNILP